MRENANGLTDKLMCLCRGEGFWLRWEGKAILSQLEISLIQGWPGLQTFIIQEEAVLTAGRQRRGHVVFQNDRAALPFEPSWRQIGLDQQPGWWRGEMYKAHVGILLMTASFFSFSPLSCRMSPAAVCHCVLVTLQLYHSPTRHTNHTVQWSRLILILTLDM